MSADTEIRGVVLEHWVDKALRLHQSINLEGHHPRISASTLVKLNNLKNRLQGTNYSLHEAHTLAADQPVEV